MSEISREEAIKELDDLTMYVEHAFSEGHRHRSFSAIKTAIEDMKKLQDYETRLSEAYGECDTLLDVIVDGMVRQAKENGIEQPRKVRLLTDEHVDLWEQSKADREKLQKIEELFEPKSFGEYPSNYEDIAKEIQKILKGDNR